MQLVLLRVRYYLTPRRIIVFSCFEKNMCDPIKRVCLDQLTACCVYMFLHSWYYQTKNHTEYSTITLNDQISISFHYNIKKLVMEVVSLRRNRLKKNIIMSTVSKPYIIFVSILFLLLSIYPFYVLFLYPMFQFLSIFVPFDPSYVVIPFSIFTYVYIMYEVFYNRRSILC